MGFVVVVAVYWAVLIVAIVAIFHEMVRKR
jgi:hypothetical protein